MNIQHTHDFQPCVPGAFGGGLSRTLFFDGMVLTEEDMMREQAYWRMKRRLTNRALGQGIVWGLGLHWDARSRCFTLCPGYGLSCCGDDLVVECPETVCERDLIDPCSEEFRRLLADPLDRCEENPHPDAPVEACLLLEYVECPEDPRRVYEDPCAQTPKGCRFGAVRETTRLRLVPPPPPEPAGPIDRFCKAVADTKAALAAAGTPMPEDLFDEHAGSRAALSGMGYNGAEERDSGFVDPGSPLTLSIRHVNPGPAPDPNQYVRLRIQPPAGYFFASVIVAGVERTGVGTMLEIAEDRTSPEYEAPGWNVDIDAEIAPLFWSGDSKRVRYHVTGSRVGFLNAERRTEAVIEMTVVEVVPRRPDCASLLAEGLFVGDRDCVLKTLAMALVHGWFVGALGAAPCHELEDDEVSARRAALAWMVCKVTWEALFGIDLEAAPAVQKCLQRLFAEWCEGFHYKGPRCEGNAHGIFLGCVEISPKGKILCFREWSHRRYVLTGPLLTHWAGQLGLLPRDVTVARLASWICCVAGAPLPAPPSEQEQGPQFDFAGPEGTALAMGANALVFSADAGAATAGGAPVTRRREVQPAGFIREALADLLRSDREPVAAASAVEVVSLRGGSLHLVRAAPGGASANAIAATGQADPVRAEIASNVAAVPAMARQPISDFVAALAEATPVTTIKPESDSRTFDLAAAALEEAGIATVADLLRGGAEPAADKVRTALAGQSEFGEANSVDRSVALIFDVAARLLTQTADAIAAQAAARDPEEPFTRADLADSGTINAVRAAVNPHLKGRGMSAKALRDLAGATIAARR